MSKGVVVVIVSVFEGICGQTYIGEGGDVIIGRYRRSIYNFLS